MVSLPSGLAKSGFLSTVLRNIGYILLWLRNRYFFICVAVYTTFRESIHTARSWLMGDVAVLELVSVFTGEASSKFLGAAVHLSEGLASLLEWLTLSGVLNRVSELGMIRTGFWSIWTGLAGLYMALFLYGLIAGKGMDREISWHEQALVLLLVLSLTANVHGVSVLERLLDNLVSLGDALAQTEGNVSSNASGVTGSNSSV